MATAAISARTARVTRLHSVGGARRGAVAGCDVVTISLILHHSGFGTQYRLWCTVPDITSSGRAMNHLEAPRNVVVVIGAGGMGLAVARRLAAGRRQIGRAHV